MMNPHLRHLPCDHLYHLGIHEDMDLPALFSDTRIVCMGGSALRAKDFAQKLADELPLGVPRDAVQPIGKTERFVLYKVGPVLSVSHGMGIGSIRILLHEITKLLHYAGARGFSYVRIGTSGGIGIEPGTVILTETALNPKLEPLDEIVKLGTVQTYPTHFDPVLTRSLYDVREDLPVVLGNTVSANCFYEEQTRFDGALDPGYSREEQQSFLRHLASMGIRNYEMESTALAGFCHRAKIPAACACVSLLNRFQDDLIFSTPEELAVFSDRAQALVLKYLRKNLAHFSRRSCCVS